jgi:hypothetical protein
VRDFFARSVGAGAIALVVSQALYFHVFYPGHVGAVWMSGGMGLAAVIVYLSLWFSFRRLEQKFGYGVSRRGVYLRCLAIPITGLLLAAAIPLRSVPAEPLSVEIRALGTKDAASKATEIWFHLDVDGSAVPLADFSSDGNWIEQSDYIVSVPYRQPALASWSGRANGGKLSFITHDWSGIVRVTENGVSRDLNLYRAPGGSTTTAINLVDPAPGVSTLKYPHRSGVQWWVLLVDAMLLGFGVVLLYDICAGTFVRRRIDPERVADMPAVSPPGLRDFLIFSMPQALSYLGALLLFYPGIMTSDSLDQWLQADTGLLNDWHPPMHTLLEAGLRLLWDSPACIALFQALALAASPGALHSPGRSFAPFFHSLSYSVSRFGKMFCTR